MERNQRPLKKSLLRWKSGRKNGLPQLRLKKLTLKSPILRPCLRKKGKFFVRQDLQIRLSLRSFYQFLSLKYYSSIR